MNPNVELRSVLVLRLFVSLALAGPNDLDPDEIQAIHDWLYLGGIRHDALNAATDGPVEMAIFLIDYAKLTQSERDEGLRDAAFPLWFVNNGGPENFPVLG